MAKSLFQFFEDVNTEKMISDIEIKQFNVEYYALDPNTTSDVITSKDEVSTTGNFHLTEFVHSLAKVIGQKQQGEVTITFAMTDLYRKKQYLIEIKYTHNREKGIGVFIFKANNRESKTNINAVKINQNIITPKEKAMFSRIRSDASDKYPPEKFMLLLYVIYYGLKATLKTENYSKKINAAKPTDNAVKEEPTPKEGDMTPDDGQSK
jgi:hypothetical protein